MALALALYPQALAYNLCANLLGSGADGPYHSPPGSEPLYVLRGSLSLLPSGPDTCLCPCLVLAAFLMAREFFISGSHGQDSIYQELLFSTLVLGQHCN